MRTLLCAAAAIAFSVLTACGSGNGTAVPANIRLVNDTTSKLDLDLNTATTISQVAVGTSSAYTAVPPGTYTQSLATAGTNVPTSTGNIGLGTGQTYTTIAFLHNADIQAQNYPESQALPSTGYSSLNIANLSIDAGPVDVYLVAHNTLPAANSTPTFSSVAYLGLSTAQTIASSSATVAYDIVVTGFGNSGDVRLTFPNPTFASAQQYTLALTSTPGGGLVNGVLIPQSVAIAAGAFHPNTQARVRLLSALPVANQQEVIATVGATALVPDVAPDWTAYQTVPAASTITALTVAGSAIANPAIPGGTFTAGHDYTILVYGAANAPLATVFDDVNQIKANSASVRVINAAVNASINLFVNGSSKISSVPYGSDSGFGAAPGVPLVYAGVAPSSSPSLQLSGGGYNQTLTGATSVPLVTGSVRTIFVYDATQPPLVVADR